MWCLVSAGWITSRIHLITPTAQADVLPIQAGTQCRAEVARERKLDKVANMLRQTVRSSMGDRKNGAVLVAFVIAFLLYSVPCLVHPRMWSTGRGQGLPLFPLPKMADRSCAMHLIGCARLGFVQPPFQPLSSCYPARESSN